MIGAGSNWRWNFSSGLNDKTLETCGERNKNEASSKLKENVSIGCSPAKLSFLTGLSQGYYIAKI